MGTGNEMADGEVGMAARSGRIGVKGDAAWRMICIPDIWVKAFAGRQSHLTSRGAPLLWKPDLDKDGEMIRSPPDRSGPLQRGLVDPSRW